MKRDLSFETLKHVSGDVMNDSAFWQIPCTCELSAQIEDTVESHYESFYEAAAAPGEELRFSFKSAGRDMLIEGDKNAVNGAARRINIVFLLATVSRRFLPKQST